MNYIGLLQEKCIKATAELPMYCELEQIPGKTFKFRCSFVNCTTEGTGLSKKYAKQEAAKLMLEKIECEHILESLNNDKIKGKKLKSEAVAKLMAYCQKEKKSKPLFSEKPNEDGLFVIECLFNNFTGVGKGTNKKVAKEMSADNVVKHFKIYEYFENPNKHDVRQESFKNPVTQLYELCHKRKLSVGFNAEKVITDNKSAYRVTCTAGEFETKSLGVSKRGAKLSSSELMLDYLLNSMTPVSSPIGKPQQSCTDESDTTPLLKKAKIDYTLL